MKISIVRVEGRIVLVILLSIMVGMNYSIGSSVSSSRDSSICLRFMM